MCEEVNVKQMYNIQTGKPLLLLSQEWSFLLLFKRHLKIDT